MAITDDGLKALLDSEIANALGYVGKLSAQRQKALWYYHAEAKLELAPPEVDGRSAVVSPDVSDTIEWIMPALVKMFAGGDDAVRFDPQNEEDEDGAEQATAYCNYVFYRKNPGFTIIHNWFKDALLEKAGIVKTYWDSQEDVAKEDYEGLTVPELAILLQDKSVEVVSQSARPDPDYTPPPMPAAPAMMQGYGPQTPPPAPMLYDVTVKRTKKAAQVRIENVPPEEFLLSRSARTMDEPIFLCHRVRKTVSYLKAMGFSSDQIERCQTDDYSANLNQEHLERVDFDDETASFRQEEGEDQTRRTVWLHECYINVDYDDDGIAELRKILKCGTEILENDAVDEHPFSLITPIMMPHRVIGLSVADILFDIQRIKTQVWRQYLDSLNLSTAPRLYVDTTRNVNLDDLLLSRPGGIVRGDGPDGVTPLITPNVGADALQGLQVLDDMRENRTGVTKYNQGTDSQSLNKTATGVNAIMQASNQRIELIGRIFAETGVSDLFRKILKLSSQHAEQPVMVRLNNKYVPVDPRQWKTGFDVTINVGLGTGNKDQIMQHMMLILQAQQQVLGLGVATPKNVYAALSELTKAAGFKDVGRFWRDPSSPPSQDPGDQMPNHGPPPEVMKAQIQAQADQQIAQQKMQSQMAVEQAQMQADQQVQAARAQADMAVQQHKVQTDAQLQELKMRMEMQQKFLEARIEQMTELMVAKIKASAQVQAADITASKMQADSMYQQEMGQGPNG